LENNHWEIILFFAQITTDASFFKKLTATQLIVMIIGCDSSQLVPNYAWFLILLMLIISKNSFLYKNN